MATGMIKNLARQEQGLITSQTAYNISYTFLPEIGICTVYLTGNGNTPTAGTVDYQLPTKITPKNSVLGNLRHDGSAMEVRSDGKLRVFLVAQYWNSGYITYVI